jgi:hypothetical protein
MDLLKEVYDLKETVGHKIAQANKKIKANGGDIANDDVEIIDKLTHSLKSLVTTCAMLEAEDDDGGYSGRYMPTWNPGISYGRDRRDGGNSYENRDGYSGNRGGYSRNRYSRENRNGYSRTGEMSEQLRQMMEEAPDDMTRMEIKKLMDKMDQR